MRKRTSTTHLLPPRDEFSSRWPCRRSFCQPRAGHQKLTLRKVRPRVQVLAVPKGRRESARQSKLTYQGSCRSKYTASGLNRHHRAGRRPTHVRRLASLAQNPPRAAFDPASLLFGQPLVLWKSDHQSACLNLPVHPGWQIRPIVSVDGRLRIVRRLVFGSRAFPRIWVTDRCGPYRVDLHLRDGRRFDPISTVCGNTLASATPNS
jgi:hypothetical protein